ncbi:MAG: hypothetical protein IJ660_00280 [Alphaproteobacteria bacterium]|nr:hypothetical protein [Alphaproteobacteria bacterium]
MTVSKFCKKYSVRSYECDKHQNLRLLTLMNILQDAADSHADALGVGYEFCVAHGLAWVAANYHVKILRAPKIHENIEIQTWPSEERKLSAIRDYEITDEKGNILVQASTQWVLINAETKRPQPLRSHLPFYDILDEKADNYDFIKLALPDKYDIEKKFAVRFDDIDVNNHVNNAVYPLWISEAVDGTFRDTHTISELELIFKKPAVAGEIVKIASAFEENNSLHLITTDDGRELVHAAVKWILA